MVKGKEYNTLESTNIGNFTAFVDEKKYLNLEPYDVPVEIDHFKKWLRRIFSLKMVKYIL